MRTSGPVAAVAAGLLLVACTSSAGRSTTPRPTPPSPPTTTPAPSPPPGSHVFVVVMENKSATEALSQPYTSSLARQFSVLSNYRAVSHPSAPNYLALTSGSTWGRHDDAYVTLPSQDIGHQLTAAGRSWRAYLEGLPTDCRQNTNDYAVKHNPFAYYGGACPPQVVPLSRLAGDLAGATPSFVWITPNLCHDTHDCPLATGDAWLHAVVPQIMASPAWQQGGVLFITWDEDDSSSANRVATLVVSPQLRPTQPGAPYDHRSLLATIEDRLGLPRLAPVASTTPIDLCC